MKSILDGCIDMHVHTAPDAIPRKMSDLELAKEAASKGMRAILVKSHNLCTVGSAYAASQAVPEIRMFGSIVLNYPVGGLNPAAVEVALKAGAREVWMPTISARNHLAGKGGTPGLSVLNENGYLKDEVKEILKLIAQYDAIMGTGHLSSLEIGTLVPAAKSIGVKKIMITHPEFPAVNMSIEQQLELKKFGVFFERTYVCTTPPGGNVSIQVILEGIKSVGAGCTILSTDFGQPVNPSPIQGMEMYIRELLALGINERELEWMVKDNAATLLEI